MSKIQRDEAMPPVESWPAIWRRTAEEPPRSVTIPSGTDGPNGQVPLVMRPGRMEEGRPNEHHPIPHICRAEFFTAGETVSDNGLHDAEMYFKVANRPWGGLPKLGAHPPRGSHRNGARFSVEESESLTVQPWRLSKGG